MPRRSTSEKAMDKEWMSLSAANAWKAYAKERGVSKVARGETKSSQTDVGFMQAYSQCNGRVTCMRNKPVKRSKPDGQTWDERRLAFIKRHWAQMKRNNRPLFETSGKWKGLPTRQHTGLIMWAWSPVDNATLRGKLKLLDQ